MQRARITVLFGMICLLAGLPAFGRSVELHDANFPERQLVELSFAATQIAPAADIEVDVIYRQGQARIELSYDDIKPAILFGGDVTCFVVWAVSRDGNVENLGELWTRKLSGRLKYSTGKKNFALMVTAESYYLVNKPSELVVFYSKPITGDASPSQRFTFDQFVDAPRHSMDGIAHIIWDSKVPLDLLQARKAHELAARHDADKHAQKIFAEATTMLGSANSIATTAPRSRELLDQARRAVALSNEALNVSMRRIEDIELGRRIAERRAETEALEQRAAEAEASAARARELMESARAEQERMLSQTAELREQKVRLENAMAALNQEKTELQGHSTRLTLEKADLEAEANRLREERVSLQAEADRVKLERDQIEGRLQGALSHVADTHDTARGLVVNLPDILFDFNEATLKPEAKVVLAKMAGILLIMPDQKVTIEGHTDSTGSEAYNLDLSQRRADAVRSFLQAQALEAERLTALGLGMQQPVADNATDEGRRKNRRVEIVISQTGSTPGSN